MVFNRKASFFLDLGSEGATPAKVTIAEAKPAAAQQQSAPQPASQQQARQKPAAQQQTNQQQSSQQQSAPAQASADAAPATSNQTTSPASSGLTTAEAIAAELRAAQEAMPAPSLSTFAPDCLNPANALRSRRRLAGANLAGFKAMASGMFRN